MTAQILWTADEAARATGGRAIGTWEATGVSIDSRSVAAGDFFVAIQGPHFDGHGFVADALQKGAAAAMVSAIPDGLPADAPLLIVEDTLEALRGLACAARGRTGAKVIAVTGSVGKTGTKEALRLVLGRQGSCHATEGNLNNHWGLPLSLARMPKETDFAVLEMGMNHPGEITPLSEMAQPHVAVITTVEAVHSEFFSSTDEIADAKAEIFDGMGGEGGGSAILNRDNPHFERLAAAARRKGLTVIAFGSHEAADVRVRRFAIESDGSSIEAWILGQVIDCRIGAPGRHWVNNSLAVLGATAAAGANVKQAAAALEDLRPPEGRGRQHTIPYGAGHFTVVDESYNASPVSMQAAFETLAHAAPDGGRRIAVLGDMLELGADSDARHAALSEPLIEAGVDLVFTAGPRMAHLWEALPKSMRGGHGADSEQLSPMVTAAVRPDDLVMVKGSAGSRMGVIVAALIGLGGGGTDRVVNGD